jgi:hypothetical protein
VIGAPMKKKPKTFEVDGAATNRLLSEEVKE